MNYARNYLNVSSLAEKIRQSASVGKVEKAAGGLAARERRREMATEEPDFEVIRAQYMNMVQDMFGEVSSAKEIEEYLSESSADGALTFGGTSASIFGRDNPLALDMAVAELEKNDVDYSRIASGIREAADALGMSPEDLATIISYETAGTFSPTQKGPTTKWGQHKGLIQFGEPQAEEYGVDWENPYDSQLGAEGAIVKYFLDRGFEPGMGMLDAYSIVNAGAPGLYSASDTAAGGAPGTVKDKVEKQMAGHRAKARKLLGDF